MALKIKNKSLQPNQKGTYNNNNNNNNNNNDNWGHFGMTQRKTKGNGRKVWRRKEDLAQG